MGDFILGMEVLKRSCTSVAANMPHKQATTLDFQGSHLPTRDTVLGCGAPAPSDGNPGPLNPAPGLERVSPQPTGGWGDRRGPHPYPREKCQPRKSTKKLKSRSFIFCLDRHFLKFLAISVGNQQRTETTNPLQNMKVYSNVI